MNEKYELIKEFVFVERQLPLNDRLRKFSSVNIFNKKIMDISGMICRQSCPNRSGVGAIDNPDRFEQFFIHVISQTLQKTLMDDISMARDQRMYFFGVYKAFINNFTYYSLYKGKLNVITQKKYALHFFIRPLDFPPQTLEH